MAVKCTRKQLSRKKTHFAAVKSINHADYKILKWWNGPIHSGRRKWKSLEHNGPLFAAEYKPLPKKVKFYYDGLPMKLSKLTQEVAGFYAKMLNEKYTKKATFNKNFFKDWRNVMTQKEKKKITNFKKCDFRDIQRFYMEETAKIRHSRDKEKMNKENAKLAEKFGFCFVDGNIQKVANFRMEPPGLFRGRGNHPKMGKLKRRILPEDVILNIGKDAPVPKPPPGHKWKEIVHNNTVTWLARWTDNKSTKYMMLHPSSKVKGQNDMEKYELARKLKRHLPVIRKKYLTDLDSLDEHQSQKAVAVYFIDKLALRTGYEKDAETADTVGCCSLRVEHIELSPRFNGERYVIHLDFPGKDSIRYSRSIAIDERVYRNLQEFLKYKTSRNMIFDSLNPTSLNKYLNDLMENLTVKVFRTCHASTELESELKKMTKGTMSLDGKLHVYNMANRSAAILCNHQRAVPKTYRKSLKSLQRKIKQKTEKHKEFEKYYHQASREEDGKDNAKFLRKKKILEQQIQKLKLQETTKIQNKDVALSTSKLNYLDPRVTVAWCKKWDIPIEKVFNKTQRERFLWASETTNANFKF